MFRCTDQKHRKENKKSLKGRSGYEQKAGKCLNTVWIGVYGKDQKVQFSLNSNISVGI